MVPRLDEFYRKVKELFSGAQYAIISGNIDFVLNIRDLLPCKKPLTPKSLEVKYLVKEDEKLKEKIKNIDEGEQYWNWRKDGYLQQNIAIVDDAHMIEMNYDLTEGTIYKNHYGVALRESLKLEKMWNFSERV